MFQTDFAIEDSLTTVGCCTRSLRSPAKVRMANLPPHRTAHSCFSEILPQASFVNKEKTSPPPSSASCRGRKISNRIHGSQMSSLSIARARLSNHENEKQPLLTVKKWIGTPPRRLHDPIRGSGTKRLWSETIARNRSSSGCDTVYCTSPCYCKVRLYAPVVTEPSGVPTK